MMHTAAGCLAAAAALALAAEGARAQAGWTLEVDDEMTGPADEATVTLFARFSPGDFAFATGELDIEIEILGGMEIEWSDLETLIGPVGEPGTPGPGGITGIAVGQVHLPPIIAADPENPIAVWRATARLVESRGGRACIRTATDDFTVYPLASSTAREPRAATEGSARLVLPGAPDPEFCYADCDGSQELDFFDFLCFQNLFAAGNPWADCNFDCFTDFFDFLCFQDEFALGCQ